MRVMALAITSILLAVGCEGPKADLSARSLRAAYGDVRKANERYKDLTVAVSGVVKWVGYTSVQPAGSQSIYLGEPGPGKEVLVICQFPPETAGQAACLREGQAVVIRGLCRGDLWHDGTPCLSQCAVLR